MSRVAIHLWDFPVPSEVFVVEQARTLQRYEPLFCVRTLLHETPFDVLALEREGSGAWLRRAFALNPGLWAYGGRAAFNGVKVFHAHFGPNGVYAIPMARALRIPLIVTFHGFDATVSRLRLMKGISGVRYAIGQYSLKQNASRVLAVSNFIRARLIDAGYEARRVKKHYIGVDTERFKPAEGRDGRESFILCVSRHIEAKGVRVLIGAFARVAPRFPAFRLVLVGDGPLHAEFKREAEMLGIAGRVDFSGIKSHQEVAKLMRKASVFVLASQKGADGWQEAFGLVSIEAAASGTPVIGTRHGGIPETLVEGETGLLVAEGSETELAEALSVMLDDASLRERLGRRGREWVCDTFDLHKQTAKLEDIYDAVIDEHNDIR